jgi:chromodomain-helicase-DNA-binding protein 4
MFTQFVRPILQKENPKTPSSKLMMLIAAKWREFCEENPCLKENDEEEEEKSEEDEEEEEEEVVEEPVEYQPKSSRSRSSRHAEKQQQDDEEEEFEDDKRKKRSSARTGKKGKKQKVPTLKIRIGKKKDASSEEEKVTRLQALFFNLVKNSKLLLTSYFCRRRQPRVNETAMLSLRKCY